MEGLANKLVVILNWATVGGERAGGRDVRLPGVGLRLICQEGVRQTGFSSDRDVHVWIFPRVDVRMCGFSFSAEIHVDLPLRHALVGFPLIRTYACVFPSYTDIHMHG